MPADAQAPQPYTRTHSAARPALQRYSIAVLAIGASLVLRLLLEHWLHGRVPFVVFVPAIVLAAWYGGMEAGLAAAAVGALAGGVLLDRESPWQHHTAANVTSVVVYALAAATIVMLGGRQRQSRDQAAADAEERRRSEERLAVTLQSISDAVLATDTEGRVTFLNTQAERLTGWTATEAAGRPCAEVLALSDARSRQPLAAPVAQALRDGRRVAAADSTVLRARDGSERRIEHSTSPIVGPGGNLYGAILTFRDIASRLEAQDSLRRQAELLDLAQDAIFVHDLEGRITFWNRGAERMYGYTRSEAVGRDAHDLLQTQFPVPLDQVREHIERTGAWEGELRHRTHDGGTLVVMSRWALQRDDGGLPLAVLEITTDVTERRLSERALRDSEARLRAILNTAIDAIVTIDEHGLIETFSPAAERLFGYDADEVVGKNVSALMPSPYREEHDTYLIKYLQTGQAKIIGAGREVEGLRRDGTTFPIDLAVGEVWLGERRIFTGLIRDLSEHKKLEAQLLQAQKMEGIGRLAGGVAHDFNNLLTAIVGYTELAQDTLAAEDPARPLLDNVQKAATRAAGLTRQLLAFARKQIIEPRILNLNELILDIDKMLRRIIGEDIELVTVPNPDVGCVKVDPSQFEQILVNLVVNARDAMPNGGKLTVETDNVTLDEDYSRQHPEVPPGEYVLLAVSDTGTGMTEDVRSRIFEPFFTTKEQGKGTGLGLATCYGIVKQSGGHIWVYSEIGKGTAFKVYLPRVREQGGVYHREEPGGSPTGHEVVLVVEDEPLVRETACRALGAQGYDVLEAENGADALRVASEHPGRIDLVVTDVIMPQMGGKELVTRLEKVRPGIRVLYTSGYTDQAIVQHGVLEPGILFLQKPFTPSSLARKVREVLDSTPA